MSSDSMVVHVCECAEPAIKYDKISEQAFCFTCGGVMADNKDLLITRINELAQALLDNQEAQNQAIQQLMQSLQVYGDYLEKEAKKYAQD